MNGATLSPPTESRQAVGDRGAAVPPPLAGRARRRSRSSRRLHAGRADRRAPGRARRAHSRRSDAGVRVAARQRRGSAGPGCSSNRVTVGLVGSGAPALDRRCAAFARRGRGAAPVRLLVAVFLLAGWGQVALQSDVTTAGAGALPGRRGRRRRARHLVPAAAPHHLPALSARAPRAASGAPPTVGEFLEQHTVRAEPSTGAAAPGRGSARWCSC